MFEPGKNAGIQEGEGMIDPDGKRRIVYPESRRARTEGMRYKTRTCDCEECRKCKNRAAAWRSYQKRKPFTIAR